MLGEARGAFFLAVAKLAADLAVVLEAAADGNDRAKTAIEIFCYRLAKAIAGLVVPLGRIDALIFTGGIGEHAAPVRASVLKQLSFLGFEVDPARNQRHGQNSQGQITTEESTIALVVPTDEEQMIAQDCLTLI